MIRYRPFRNSDPPALAELWNRMILQTGAVGPIRAHELDDHAFGSVVFDRAGLIVAERENRVVGFVHAGFGPDQPVESSTPFAVSTSLGTIAMLVTEPESDRTDLASGLILQAERYLRQSGAKVLYAGGQFPLNPFYWGLYARSEGSGVLDGHPSFPQILKAMGYESISTTVALEFDLEGPDPRDPRGVIIRRQTRLDIDDDPVPSSWWENQALSEFRLTSFRLVRRSDGAELARATTWDMSWFGRQDGQARLGLIAVEVSPAHRRQGFGRFLVSEVIRWARPLSIGLIEVQTPATNQPALALYQSLGFQVIDQSTVYRLPGHLIDRSRTNSFEPSETAIHQ